MRENSPGNPGHYFGDVQPIDFFMDVALNSLLVNVVKYVFRYKNKNGLEDLQKALWYMNNYEMCLVNGADPIAAGDLIASHPELSEEQVEVLLDVELLLTFRNKVAEDFDLDLDKQALLEVTDRIKNNIEKIIYDEFDHHYSPRGDFPF